MPHFSALFDACVLYPAPLRDLLMRLALIGLFQAKWSAQIHEEWMRNVLQSRPDLSRERLEKTRELMDRHATDALVEGYEHLIHQLELPDEGDRHVLAAAIHAKVDVIVTFNLKDFPRSVLRPYGILPLHPDVFLCELLDIDQDSVCQAVREQRLSLKNPPKTARDLLETLEQQGLKKSVERLNEKLALL
ncbi:PIN domain-containing protein [Myxococcota bacterium]|nr:PIN domain-containing protein [Myxococcota bacterium]